ncbi:nuclear transport factor 2 family protein [Phytoactinopolyspora halotolerans]|uniref:Nuclear transport factor 2 family protein n=1 Tax=Phytoactinopolyspora halotolerans TaxID=1981512 RepID=A0A6L9SGD9_9ACTN|nr:nuclear transport factor 2 family protein [Phytoactinopolyspora halotolerans]NEE03704.1 nuclear transport factor 2 family protein [Phytoactinopolyspora halotolerans]
MSASANKTTVRSFITAISDGDIAAVRELLTDDAVWWLPGTLPVSGRYEGPEAVVNDFLSQGLNLYRPGSLTFEITSMIEEAGSVSVEWTARGLSAAGREYQNYYNVNFTVRGGRISEIREYTDTLYVSDVLYA